MVISDLSDQWSSKAKLMETNSLLRRAISAVADHLPEATKVAIGEIKVLAKTEIY